MIIEQDVLAAKSGDKEAFIRLIKSIEHSLFQTAKTILKHDEDTADALQETILKAYQSINKLKHVKYFKTWIFRILINECNTMIAKRSKTVPMEYIEKPVSISHHDQQIEMQDAIEKLPMKQRMVIVLHYFQDMTLKQVADTLDLSESAVKKRLQQAKVELLHQFNVNEKEKMQYESI
ncbi:MULTISPECIES: sigma-70 family RNA polymerase sigma factor [unclassified Bacillus (in: firmicutes)]|uniref:sigma-70 family RNA polymerase sigma factor n=1 Tax=unclassified Bacillus (in: firmicutes) TaxID=185979 RepID=UPI0008EC06C4|nr:MULTISPECIES: sigma-70 family RNA polymerase sigma factor [unclassified Bacillus (in: firmicutes)]SFK15922.1 RNA polymerase sigma-70 factor, ECF subfamily [Bacillus sp. 71mf]SFT24281.1 RNA polymerase sigma-70 factor, ECF subfamily [Bacillus sp. 103mf]